MTLASDFVDKIAKEKITESAIDKEVLRQIKSGEIIDGTQYENRYLHLFSDCSALLQIYDESQCFMVPLPSGLIAVVLASYYPYHEKIAMKTAQIEIKDYRREH